MKLRSTTPASVKSIAQRALLIAAVLLVAVVTPIQISQSVSADPYDDKINALQQDISRYQAEADRLNNEAMTLSSAVAQLANQKAAIQAQIDINQAKYDKLIVDIAATEQKIKDNQDVLGDTIADLYVDAKISPLEMLASSKNISEYLDKQEYRNSVRDQLTSTIAEIKELKIQLDQQKTDVEKILNDQKDQRDTLAAKESEQQSLLNRTNNDEAAYQQLIGVSQAQIAEARATQAALRNRFNNTGGYVLIDGGSLSDYPWNSSNCPMWGYMSTGGYPGTDGEDGHGYGCRQCASYVAWRIAKETNVYPSWGDAKSFTSAAENTFGYRRGAPTANSIAVMDPAKAGQGYGHVAWVESVNGDGTVTVSQYNYDYGSGYGLYSLMKLSVGAFDHYVRIK